MIFLIIIDPFFFLKFLGHQDLRSHGIKIEAKHNLWKKKMMDNFCDEREREDQFYDAREDLSSVSDWDSDCSDDCKSRVSSRLRYEVWAEKLGGVMERRRKFLKWMGLDSDQDLITKEDTRRGVSCDEIELDVDRVKENSGAVLRTSASEEGLLLSESSSVSSSSNEALNSATNGSLLENFLCKFRNSNHRSEFDKEEVGQGRMVGRLCVGRLEQSVSSEELRRDHRSSLSVEDGSTTSHFVDVGKKVKRGWLRRLGIGMCVVDANGDAVLSPGNVQATEGTGMQRVQVYPHRKRTKELSSFHAGQEFKAHEGSILKMKFSLDGHYLASAGEDGIVRVWKVNEDERSNQFDIAGDSSCQYFTIDHLSKIDSLEVDKEKHCKVNKLKRSSDSACAIFPPKIFNILDKPLHEFRGHSGEVLDLSWSSKGVSNLVIIIRKQSFLSYFILVLLEENTNGPKWYTKCFVLNDWQVKCYILIGESIYGVCSELKINRSFDTSFGTKKFGRYLWFPSISISLYSKAFTFL